MQSVLGRAGELHLSSSVTSLSSYPTLSPVHPGVNSAGSLRWGELYWLTGFAYGHPHIYGLGDHTDQKEILVYQNSDKLIGVENVPCR